MAMDKFNTPETEPATSLISKDARVLSRPRRLQPGDAVGVVAPASPFDRVLFEKGLAVLEALGLTVRLADGIFRRFGYLAGEDRLRAQQLNDFIRDGSIRAIICARGGYGCMRILPLIDYETLRRNPRIIAGFSDITALLNAIYSRCRLVTFHAPVVTSLAEGSDRCRRSFKSALFSDRPPTFKALRPQVFHPGTARGPVAGGNLALLSALAGTPYFPDLKGHILLLEDTGEQPYRIDRMLTQLKLAGCLDHLAGVALGSFDNCGPLEEIYAAVASIFADATIPVLSGFEVGHGGENLTLPLGLAALLDTAAGTLSYAEPGTRSRVVQ